MPDLVKVKIILDLRCALRGLELERTSKYILIEGREIPFHY